jgi:chlorite dismutase
MSYHSYIFFDAEPSAGMLSVEEFETARQAFATCIEEHAEIRTLSYSTLAMKVGTRFMLYMSAETPEAIQLFVRDLLHTPLGRHLRISYTLLGMTRPSQYSPKHSVDDTPAESEPDTPHKYLVVYPFIKTIEWHLLPFDERRSMMKAHVDVGRKYSSSISQLLLYAYGIDDYEFIVSYQMNSLEDFQTLVMELRGTEARRHTEKDTPIFTCISMPIMEALKMI